MGAQCESEVTAESAVDEEETAEEIALDIAAEKAGQDECAMMYCHNGGRCDDEGERCICQPGFTGNTCAGHAARTPPPKPGVSPTPAPQQQLVNGERLSHQP